MIDPHRVELAAWLDRYNEQDIWPPRMLTLITALVVAMMWLRLQSAADENWKNVFFVVVGTPAMLTGMHILREMYYPQVHVPRDITDLATRVTQGVDVLQTLLTEPLKYMAGEFAADSLQLILACLAVFWLQEQKLFDRTGRRDVQDVEFRYINFMAFVLVAYVSMPLVTWAVWIVYVVGKCMGIFKFCIMCNDIANWCYTTATESSGKEKVTIKDGTEPVKLWEKIMQKPGMEKKKYEEITKGCGNKTARQNALLPYLEEHLVVDDQRTKK
jgi:hypothetical protein